MATRSGDRAAPAGPGRLIAQFWVYTLLRILLFGAVFGVLWLVNVRGIFGLLIAIVLSVPLSFVLLARPRAALATALAQRVEQRQERETRLRERLAGGTDGTAQDGGTDGTAEDGGTDARSRGERE